MLPCAEASESPRDEERMRLLTGANFRAPE